LVTFNIQNFSDGIYLKDFFSTFSQWVSFPFVDIILQNGQNVIADDNISYVVKYCPGQNFIIKFNEILSMDDISYEILSHGHYFIEDNILWYIFTLKLIFRKMSDCGLYQILTFYLF
jgi:hypothetical protein